MSEIVDMFNKLEVSFDDSFLYYRDVEIARRAINSLKEFVLSDNSAIYRTPVGHVVIRTAINMGKLSFELNHPEEEFLQLFDKNGKKYFQGNVTSTDDESAFFLISRIFSSKPANIPTPFGEGSVGLAFVERMNMIAGNVSDIVRNEAKRLLEKEFGFSNILVFTEQKPFAAITNEDPVVFGEFMLCDL